MKVSEFCPDDCVWIQDNEGWKHETCKHTADIVMPTPYSAIIEGKHPKVVTIIGINGNDFYYEEIMSNGQQSRGTISRSRVKRS